MDTIFESRKAFDQRHFPYDFEPTVSITPEVIAGIRCYWFTPQAALPGKLIIYAHGGGFAMGSFQSHGKMMSHFANTLAITTLFVEYALAPEHPYPAGMDDLLAVYEAICQRYPGHQLDLVGDSAGASLIVSAVGAMLSKEMALPHAVVLISPWISFACNHPSITENAAIDISINKEMLDMFSQAYTGDLPFEISSPDSVKFEAFPPVLIMVGTNEILLDDSRYFYSYIKEVQPRAQLSIYEDQPHVWVKKDILQPASRKALAEIAAFINGDII